METTPLIFAIGCGAIVGLSLALTGSGGTALAVPVLVFGLKLRPHQAVCVSMIAVGSMALVGLIPRLRRNIIDIRTGLVMAVAGIVGAPIGAWSSQYFSERALLLVFASLMLVVAIRLFTHTGAETVRETGGQPKLGALPRHVLMSAVGFFSGMLSGLTGIGGGIVIVPALLVLGFDVRRATATSLLVIGINSVSATVSHFAAGQRVPLVTTALFASGALLGLEAGALWCERVSGSKLQHGVAAVMVLTAAFMISRAFGG